MPGVGVNSFFQIAEESVWGTSETAAFYVVPVISGDIGEDTETIQSEYITAGASRPDDTAGGTQVTGTLEFPLTYNLIDWFLKGAMGTQWKSTPTTGTNARDLWHEMGTTLVGHTIETCRGDIEAENKVNVYTGCKVDAFTITIPEKGPGRVSATFIGEEDESVAGGDAYTSSGQQVLAPQEVLASHLAAGWDVGPADDAAAGYCIKAFNLTVSRGLAGRFCQGSSQSKEPLVTDFATVDGSFDIEFDDRNVYESFRSFTQETTGNLVYEGSVIEAALKYTLEFNLNNYRFLAPSLPAFGERGVLIANCPFTGTGNAGTPGDGTPDENSTVQPVSVRTRNVNDW